MTTPLLDLQDFVEGPTAAIHEAMLALFTTWPYFELTLTQLLFLEYGLADDTGPLLIGNMDTKSKIDKLKALSRYRGDAERIEFFKSLSKSHEHHIRPRNIAAHNPFAGHLRSKPHEALFLTLKREGKLLRMESLTVNRMQESAKFAHRMGGILNGLLEAQRAEFPPAHPEGLSPSPTD